MTAFAFAPLRALGWSQPAAPPPPKRLADPTGDAITHHLVDAGLWRFGAGLSLTRDGGRLTARVFLPEHQQSDRTLGRDEAHEMRLAVVLALQLEGFVVRFSDALWCERGQKGWEVVVKASEGGW